MAQLQQQSAIEQIEKNIEQHKLIAESFKSDIDKLDAEITEAGIKGQPEVAAMKITLRDSFRKQLEARNQTIAKAVKELAAVKKQAANEEADELRDAAIETIKELMPTYNMGYSISDGKYAFYKNSADDMTSISNPQFTMLAPEAFIDQLALMAGKRMDVERDDLKECFREQSRHYTGIVASFKYDRWGSSYYNRAKVLKDSFWVSPGASAEYNPLFDDLLHCVGGGKAENIEHLEQWIVHKHKFPDRSESTPSIDLMGLPGGNGKGVYIDLLNTIFAGNCVVPASPKELDNGFNASWEMATILTLDESDPKVLSYDALKRITGAGLFRLEAKGKDARVADANFNIIFSSNGGNKGVVPLSGGGSGGVDRRWSIIKTGLSLKAYIPTKYGCTEQDALEVLHGLAQLVKNRAEVQKFLTHLFNKHSKALTGTLAALHGEDYRTQLEAQRSDINTLYDAIIKCAVNDGCIPLKLVQKIVNAGNEKPLKLSEIKEQFSNALMVNGYKAQCEKQHYDNLWGDEKGSVKDQSQVFIIEKNGTLSVNYKQYLSQKPGMSQKSWSDGLELPLHLSEEFRQYKQV